MLFPDLSSIKGLRARLKCLKPLELQTREMRIHHSGGPPASELRFVRAIGGTWRLLHCKLSKLTLQTVPMAPTETALNVNGGS